MGQINAVREIAWTNGTSTFIDIPRILNLVN
jgi:hypothetical protein